MEPSVMDALSWKDDIPVSDYQRTIRTIDMAHASDTGTRYELRGSSARWFVVRIKPDGETRRTKFFANQRSAQRVFNVLAYGAT